MNSNLPVFGNWLYPEISFIEQELLHLFFLDGANGRYNFNPSSGKSVYTNTGLASVDFQEYLPSLYTTRALATPYNCNTFFVIPYLCQ